MKFTWGWLQDHLDTSADMAAILDALPMLGLEVEAVIDRSAELAPFIIAKITKATKHPEADSLALCSVDTGSGKAQVICGAPNAKAGLVGVFAPIGAYVPGIDLTIKEVEIRGIPSSGMMCSEREMMLSDEHDGIIELAEDAPLGESFAKWAGLNDPIIEVAITPNRADCLGVRGIARDLAAAGYGKLKPLKEKHIKSTLAPEIQWQIDLNDEDKHLVPRIAGRLFQGLKNGQAPQWMRQRLEAVGQRSISALVDITNYVMIDLNRPLHSYDADKLVGNRLIVRRAKAGEEFIALNEKTYKLDPNMLIIGDEKGADGLAGIMGGERTGVSESTTAMFLEMAIFDPVNVATTGRKLNLNSDARYRFERGLDATAPDWAMDYVSGLVMDICGGIASETHAIGDGGGWQREIAYRPARVMELAACQVSPEKQAEILKSLGFEVTLRTSEEWTVSPPPWRGDIDGEADLVEEVVRITGYDAIPEIALPRGDVVSAPAVDAAQKRPYTIRRLLAERGMMEAVTFSFLDQKSAKRFGGGGDKMRLVNPISTELDTMRPSIMPNLLAAMMQNAARGEYDASIFEVGPIFLGDEADEQRTSITGLRVGMTAHRHWAKTARAFDWADARGDAMAVLAALGVNTANLQTGHCDLSWYHPGQSGTLCQGRKILAHFGTLHPAALADYDLKVAAGFEIILDDIALPKNKGAARPLLKLPPFQPVYRDFAFILDRDVSAEQLIRAIKGGGKPLVTQAEVFDLYEGKGVAEGQKSVAVSVTIQPIKATLTEAEIADVSAAIIEAVVKHCDGVLRQ